MVYKIGDQVKLQPNLIIGLGKCVDIAGVTKGMQQYQGKIVTIVDIIEGYHASCPQLYEIEEDGQRHFWTKDMIQTVVKHGGNQDTSSVFIKEEDGNITKVQVAFTGTNDDGTKAQLAKINGRYKLLENSSVPTPQEVKTYKENERLLADYEELKAQLEALTAKLKAKGLL